MQFKDEREGQENFFMRYNIPYKDDMSILIDNTDGVYNGIIMEFKLSISNQNKVLFQAIKYLSRMRVKGESVPATILLIDLSRTTVYKYDSIDYINEIQKIYVGSASKNNDGFVANNPKCILNYSNNLDSSIIRKLFITEKKIQELYIPIDIDENCIVGWAERYYREIPTAKKGDFLGDDTGSVIHLTGEIRRPNHFLHLINPYSGETNNKFKYLMDCLNDRLSKKELGAFYTHPIYAKKSVELLLKAIKRIPKEFDYVILDRCAGTGNLEEALIGIKDHNDEYLIEHSIVSTYEYYEFKVLNERLGGMVREIIPPTEADVIYENGKVSNADAMSKDFIENPIIQQYITNPKCAVILFENPPYNDSTSNTFRDENGKGGKVSRTNSFVHKEFKKNTSSLNENTSAARDFANLFIWSGFNYYLRQPYDSYILFSPVKYFKTVGLANMEFSDGFIFNRKHFHATESAISCIYWKNIPNTQRTSFDLTAFNICNNSLIEETIVTVRKCKHTFNEWYDKLQDNDTEDELWCASDGTPMVKSDKVDVKSYNNDNIIAALCAASYSLDAQHRGLLRLLYFHHGLFFYLRKENFIEKLPMWVAKLYPFEKWYEKNLIYNSSDGGIKYINDKNFLKCCLIYTCLSNDNKCLSFNSHDGRYFQNELCFDYNSLSYSKLSKMTLDSDEIKLLNLWKDILKEARDTGNCIDNWTYGVYQINKDINTFTKKTIGKQEKKIYDYPILNGNLQSLKIKLKEYYTSHITKKMFIYELLK